MQNSYIVDAFLTGAAWMMLAYLYFDSKARIIELDQLMTANTLAVALAKSLVMAASFAVPFSLLYVFLLWRFYGLMVQTQTWGAGGLGLLITLFCIGLPLIWLHVMLVCVRHSRFFALSKQTSNERDPAH